jgi:hypothetical protein
MADLLIPVVSDAWDVFKTKRHENLISQSLFCYLSHELWIFEGSTFVMSPSQRILFLMVCCLAEMTLFVCGWVEWISGKKRAFLNIESKLQKDLELTWSFSSILPQNPLEAWSENPPQPFSYQEHSIFIFDCLHFSLQSLHRLWHRFESYETTKSVHDFSFVTILPLADSFKALNRIFC